MSEVSEVGVEKLVRVYVKIRNKQKELSAEFKQKDDELQQQLRKVELALLQHCKDHEVESVRTNSGTFFRRVKTRYWTENWEAMHRFIVENQLPDFLERRLHQSNVKQFLADNPDNVPPGLSMSSEYAITVNTKGAKKK